MRAAVGVAARVVVHCARVVDTRATTGEATTAKDILIVLHQKPRAASGVSDG